MTDKIVPVVIQREFGGENTLYGYTYKGVSEKDFLLKDDVSDTTWCWLYDAKNNYYVTCNTEVYNSGFDIFVPKDFPPNIAIKVAELALLRRVCDSYELDYFYDECIKDCNAEYEQCIKKHEKEECEQRFEDCVNSCILWREGTIEELEWDICKPAERLQNELANEGIKLIRCKGFEEFNEPPEELVAVCDFEITA